MADRSFILVDHYHDWSNLRPLTLTRSIADLRVGMTTIKEKWETHLQQTPHIKTIAYLQPKYSVSEKGAHISTYINASFLPDKAIVGQIKNLTPGQSLYSQKKLVASCVDPSKPGYEEEIHYNEDLAKINHPWDLFLFNEAFIEKDFHRLTKNRASQAISKTNQIIGDKQRVFLEEGAAVEGATFNTAGGPVYIGRNAQIMEGALVRGPVSIGEHAVVKMGAKIYGPTCIGPYSKVGGEISHSTLLGYSNKAHDGFLGNSVIGEWCNLGADTNNSNLKNNYSIVRVWSYDKQQQISSGLQFLGLIMGDHSKSAINTMFNTGTVVGVSSNIFGGGFPKKYIPSFSWGGAEETTTYMYEKAIEVAEKVMTRRGKVCTDIDKAILKHIFNEESSSR